MLLLFIGFLLIAMAATSEALLLKSIKRDQRLLDSIPIPLATLISDFEEFSKNVEGGQLSAEAADAIAAKVS